MQKKPKYVLFHVVTKSGSVPLQLPTMKRENSAKILGVIIDENLTWKNHIEVIENQIS